VTSLPLSGLRIVVTRAAHQAGELARPLSAAGAEVILLPTVSISPPKDPARLESAARHAGEYDWLFLTSVNAANAFLPLVAHGWEWWARLPIRR
jgi:uroporphyrinogen-III synthase